MIPKYKYSPRRIKPNKIGSYIVYPESTDLNELLLRWSLGEPMQSEMTIGNYLTGLPVRPTSDLTDVDRSRRLVARLQKHQTEIQSAIESLSNPSSDEARNDGEKC